MRKSVKTIAAISSEVEEIKKRISNKESVELIRSDNSKERLKINEMLMNLLFRLDSVRGVDSGVRDYRKKVIKKAISLQEMVDLIVSNDPDVDVEDKQVIVENEEEEEESVGSADDAEIQEPEEKEGGVANDAEIQEHEKKEGGVGKEERDRNRGVLERMVEDNERMMGLMAELVESNEKQTRLLNSLSHRVEQLETAFVCEKLRRKKKTDVCGTGDLF